MSGPLRRAYAAWDGFWFPVGPADGLAVFRIAFGLYWLVGWLSWAPNVELYFSGEGMYFPRFAAPTGGIHDVYDLLGWLTLPASTGQAWLLYLATIPVLCAVIAGSFTRTALLLFLASFVYHHFLYLHMYGTSFHRILLIATVVLILSPCGAARSVDAWRARRRGRPLPERYVLWTQRLLCVQMAFVYFATGVHKVVTPAWNNGDNLAASLKGDYATPIGFWLAQRSFLTPGVYDVLTIGVILFELALGFLLFVPRWQKFAFPAGAAFHLFNAVAIWIPQFVIMIFSYVLFVDPDAVRRAIDSRLRRGAPDARRQDEQPT